jgi:parallel beta-helix repeat protein
MFYIANNKHAVTWFRFILVIALVTSLLVGNTIVVKAYQEVGGPIISDTTWTLANSPYIVTSNVQVLEGVKLTIEPGVVVKFNTGLLLLVEGTLHAKGTASKRITFTSNNINPQPGEWGNIILSGESIMKYCIVEYGGYEAWWTGVIEVNDYDSLVDHCIVRYNSSSGIFGVGSEYSPITIANNELRNNSGREGGGIYVENGIVTGNTVSDNAVSFNGAGIYAEDSIITGNSVKNNQAGGGVYTIRSEVSDNTITGNSASSGGGISASSGSVSGNTIIGNVVTRSGGGIFAAEWIWSDDDIMVIGNIVIGNSASSGGGIHSVEGVVMDNIISENSAIDIGGGIRQHGGVLTNNTITSNVVGQSISNIFFPGQGAGLYLSLYPDQKVLNNTIISNTTLLPCADPVGGVAINGQGDNYFQFNNIYDNSPYDVVIEASHDIFGENNYWGTTESVNILDQIYDWHDDTERGRLIYIPYLQYPDPDSPVPPPFNLHADIRNGSVALSWDPIPSTTTGYGYKVYYDTDSHEPPYDGTGLPQGDSPIDVGNVTEYMLTELEDDVYYVSLTAYDTLRRESWYAKFSIIDTLPKVYLPIMLKDH